MSYESTVIGMVEQSPVDLLVDHMGQVQKCVGLLGYFIETVLKEDWTAAGQLFEEVKQLEHDADHQKAAARKLLRKDLFLPMAKSELLSLLILQDGLANQTRDICGIVYGRRMTVPEEISKDFKAFSEAVIKTCEQARMALDELNTIFEAVFSRQAVEVMEAKLSELEVFETQTDHMQIEIRAKLFQVEERLNPVHAMFLYKIINRLGKLADQAEIVGQHLLLCVTD